MLNVRHTRERRFMAQRDLREYISLDDAIPQAQCSGCLQDERHCSVTLNSKGIGIFGQCEVGGCYHFKCYSQHEHRTSFNRRGYRFCVIHRCEAPDDEIFNEKAFESEVLGNNIAKFCRVQLQLHKLAFDKIANTKN